MATKKSPTTEQDLKNMGLVETSPGVFERSQLRHYPGTEPPWFKDLDGSFKNRGDDHTVKTSNKADIRLSMEELVAIGKSVNITPKLYIPVKPCPAPRMTRRDKFFLDPNHTDPKKRQRPCVTRYFAFKKLLKEECGKLNYDLNDFMRLCFVLPMPDSWNHEKKVKMLYQPHQQKPDVDNCCKAVMDSFGKDDGHVWNIHAMKIWGWVGGIVIF